MQEIKFIDKNYEDSFIGAIHEEFERTIVLFPESGRYFDKSKFQEETARTIHFYIMERLYPGYF